ncbi:MAG: tetratricopeptide repeat protein [Candidatus Thorarchaeota archaeon]
MKEERMLFEAKSFLGMGKDLFKSMSYDKAEHCFEKALDLVPDLPEAKAYLKRIREKRQEKQIHTKKNRKKKQNMRVVGSAPTHVMPEISNISQEDLVDVKPQYNEDIAQAEVRKGLNCMYENNLSEAEKIFRKIVKTNPDNVLGWIFLGDVYVLQEKNESALKAHIEARKIDSNVGPESFQTLVITGGGKDEQDEMTINRTLHLITLISEFDKSFDLQCRLFCNSTYDRNVSDAAYIFRRLKENPNRNNEWFSLGLIFEAMEKYSQASISYLRAVEIDPFHSWSQTKFVQSLWFREKGNRMKSDSSEIKSQLAMATQLVSRVPFAKKTADFIIQLDLMHVVDKAYIYWKKYKEQMRDEGYFDLFTSKTHDKTYSGKEKRSTKRIHYTK